MKPCCMLPTTWRYDVLTTFIIGRWQRGLLIAKANRNSSVFTQGCLHKDFSLLSFDIVFSSKIEMGRHQTFEPQKKVWKLEPSSLPYFFSRGLKFSLHFCNRVLTCFLSFLAELSSPFSYFWGDVRAIASKVAWLLPFLPRCQSTNFETLWEKNFGNSK